MTGLQDIREALFKLRDEAVEGDLDEDMVGALNGVLDSLLHSYVIENRHERIRQQAAQERRA